MRNIFPIFMILIAASASAQSGQIEPCGQVGLLEKLEKDYPGFKANYDRISQEQAHPKNTVQSRKVNVHDTFFTYDTIYTVQVVFHVLYNVSSENLTDAMIQSQLDVLNECYRRQNADTTNTRSFFKSRAGDVRIKFVFASKDPSGNATTGIVHKFTNANYFEGSQYADDMKFSANGGDDAWNPKKYLNIWVCDLRTWGSEGLLGYAFPPYGQPNWPSANWVADNRQGVVLHYKIVGRNNPLATGIMANAAMGKVAVHEVGHYFGLRHIWGDAQSGQQCQVDDYIDDTPLQGYKSNFDCNLSQNTCTEVNDLPDMVENYMDYSSHACQNMFTKHQINVMRRGITDFRYELPYSVEIDSQKRVHDTVLYDSLKIIVTSGQRIYFELRNGDLLNNLSMNLYDLSGRAIMRSVKLGKHENYVSTANVAPGIYVCALYDKNNKFVKKQKLFITKN